MGEVGRQEVGFAGLCNRSLHVMAGYSRAISQGAWKKCYHVEPSYSTLLLFCHLRYHLQQLAHLLKAVLCNTPLEHCWIEPMKNIFTKGPVGRITKG